MKKFFVIVMIGSGLILSGCQKALPTPTSVSPTPSEKAEAMPANTSEAMMGAAGTLRQELLTNLTLTVPETEEIISFGGEQGDWSQGYVLIGHPVAQLPNGTVAAILMVNTGGNARDVYMAVFEPGETSWQMTDAKLLGDYASNAEVTELKTDMDTVYVTYLTYSDEVLAQAEAKTVENNEAYSYLNGTLNPLN